MKSGEVVYLVWHSHHIDDDQEDEKLIGVYSTQKLAQNAIERLGKVEGFKDHLDGFEICEYELDKDHWSEGFYTVYHNGG